MKELYQYAAPRQLVSTPHAATALLPAAALKAREVEARRWAMRMALALSPRRALLLSPPTRRDDAAAMRAENAP